jgi:hypothetical protein
VPERQHSLPVFPSVMIENYLLRCPGIEDPCSKLQGIFDRRECGLFYDSLAYPAASGGECARFRGSIALHAFEKLRLLALDHSITVLVAGKLPSAHVLTILRHGLGDDLSHVAVFFDKFGSERLELPD